MENQPLQANTQPLGYSIVFSPDKPHVAVPKCVADYKSKPADSPGTLQKKLDSATERKKVVRTTYMYNNTNYCCSVFLSQVDQALHSEMICAVFAPTG